MIISGDKDPINRAKSWATQARDNAAYYEHSGLGYNYRMSNVLAGIDQGQLRVLKDHVDSKRQIFA